MPSDVAEPAQISCALPAWLLPLALAVAGFAGGFSWRAIDAPAAPGATRGAHVAVVSVLGAAAPLATCAPALPATCSPAPAPAAAPAAGPAGVDYARYVPAPPGTVPPHTLVIYNTAEPRVGPDTAEGTHGAARDTNLLFFLKQGLLPADGGYHFAFIINGAYPQRAALLAEAAKLPNVEVIYRENIGFDCCAWKLTLSEALRALDEATGGDGPPVKLRHAPRSFKFFVLMNGSVRGPYMPSFLPPAFPWPRLFTDKLSDDVRMSGLTVNCQLENRPLTRSLHVQTMVYSFRVEDLDFVLGQMQCVRGTADDKFGVIMACEHGMTRHFDEAGYNYAVMPPAWRGHDFRNKEATAARCRTTELSSAQGAGADPWFNAQRGDPSSPASLWLSPTDLVFLKTNAVYPKQTLETYEAWQLASRPSVAIEGLP